MSASPLRLRLAILLCLTGCFLLVGSREPPWADARIMYEVAENLANTQRVSVKSEWPPMSHKGPDGKVYSQYAFGPSIVHVPGVWLRNATTDRADPESKLVTVVTSHLASAFMGALTCMLFFGMCRRLGASAAAASAGTLVLAFSTMILVYARSPYSEIMQAASVLGFTGALLAVVDAPVRRNALALGAWAALVLNTKAVLALALLGGGGHLLIALRRDRAALVRVVAWSLLSAVPGVIVFLVYNYVRWGDPLDTGYGETISLLRAWPWHGLWGLFLSPGKSLFLYCPPLVIGVLASVRFAREHGGAARAFVFVGLPPLLFYACMLIWSGDWCWGPRYLTYLVPLMMVPAVVSGWPVIARSRALRAAAAALVAFGFVVQVLGIAFYWDHWIRIALNVRLSWLGNPERSGTPTKLNEFGLCDACFEDMSGHHWLPPFAAIPGHAWMLVNHGEAYRDAQPSAPWRRYTRLDMPQIEPFYKAARLDWWGFLWIQGQPSTRPIGIGILILFLAMSVGGGVGWWRRVRAATA